jgi:hypothetical protein
MVAWLAILAYHAQILCWRRPSLGDFRKPSGHQVLLFALPWALAGSLLYFLLPVITRTDLAAWLAAHHLSGVALACMLPYFGIVHPVLEQIHWRRLREDTAWSHPLFAGYHLLVLSSLLALPWLILAFAVLVAGSLAWKWLARTTGSLTVPAMAHSLADLGIVLAAWARTQ